MQGGSFKLSAKLLDNENIIFKPTSWLVKIEFINKLVLENNVLVSIVGEHGGGKSTFANVLVDSLDSQIQVFKSTATPLISEQFLLSRLAKQLDEQLAPGLDNIITFCQDTKTHTVLIIDDAQHLQPAFFVEILSALKRQNENSYFHICLVSNFSLIPVLNKLSDDYREMIHTIELGPLNEKETKEYILEKLAPQGITVFPQEDLHQFYQLTEGNIVGINTQMNSFFKKRISPYKTRNTFYKIGAAAVGAVAVLGISFFLLDTQQAEIPVAITAPGQTISSRSVGDIQTQTIELPHESEIANFQLAAVKQEIEATSLKRLELTANDEDPQAINDSLVVMDKVVVIPTFKQEVMSLKSEPQKAMAKKVQNNLIKQAALDKTKFTIQLIASHKLQDLEKFAREHSLKRTKVLTTMAQGKKWFVLTLGEYASKEQAKKAINHLPYSLIKLKPWIRSIVDLKEIS